jgi:hypothetical protein
MDEGSPGLRDKRESGKEKNERDERNGGKKKPGCFLSSIQKFKIFFFFFFWGDVEGATSARDGRWMDAGQTLRITRSGSAPPQVFFSIYIYLYIYIYNINNKMS